MLFLAAAVVFCVTVVTSAQSQQASSSSVKLGDKVIVIPNPEGFEEASVQFEKHQTGRC
jgi:S1-C subfamily serine protease